MLIDPEQVRNQVNYALRLSFIDFHFSSSTQIRARRMHTFRAHTTWNQVSNVLLIACAPKVS